MEQGFIIDGWRVYPVLNRLERQGERRPLKPRSMRVLTVLAAAGGDVVTRQDLIEAVWGRAVVTEDVLTQSIVEIRKAFADDARAPRVVETIRTVGFRLIAEVLPLETDRPKEAGPPSLDRARRVGRRWAAVAVVGLIAIGVLSIEGTPEPAAGRAAAESPPASRTATGSIEAYDYYLLGRHYQALGQYDLAKDRLERAVRADPGYAPAQAGLAELYLTFREAPSAFWSAGPPDYRSALRRADEAVAAAARQDPVSVDVLLARAQLAMARLDCPAAGALLDRALSIAPNAVPALHQKARYLTVNGQFGEAVGHFARAVERDPFNPRLVADYSRLMARMGRYEEANALVLRLVDSEIRSPALFETLMLNAEDYGRYDERIHWGHERVRLEPTRASALAELGDAYSLIGMLDVADAWIARAEAISRAQAFKARQRWLWIQRRDGEFLERANRMLLLTAPAHDRVLTPAQSATFGIAGIAKLQGGDPEIASFYLDRAIRASPTLPFRGMHIVLYGQGVLALAQRASGDVQAADRTIRQALERGRKALDQTVAGYPPLLRQLAVHHALRGDYETALAYLREAIDAGWRAAYLDGRKPGNDRLWREFTTRPEYRRLEATVAADLERMRAKVELEVENAAKLAAATPPITAPDPRSRPGKSSH